MIWGLKNSPGKSNHIFSLFDRDAKFSGCLQGFYEGYERESLDIVDRKQPSHLKKLIHLFDIIFKGLIQRSLKNYFTPIDKDNPVCNP